MTLGDLMVFQPGTSTLVADPIALEPSPCVGGRSGGREL